MHVNLRYGQDVPRKFLADPARIAQVLQNLLSNAIKFSETGDIDVLVDCSKDEAGGILSVVVRDNGCGISPESMNDLFKPFHSLGEGLSGNESGPGLGLVIARRIARRMHGDVTVSSNFGFGSKFIFTARVSVECAGGSDCFGRVNRSLDALTVLVVEDHPVNQMLLIAWLTSQGHLCQAANNGQEALAAAENETFDLILMDVNMPILDGLEATRRLRAQPSPNRNAVVVIVSASARPQDHDIAFAAGADDYLSKPVDFSALAEILGRKCALYEKRVRPAA